MICKNCGMELPDGLKICPECGYKFSLDDPTLKSQKDVDCAHNTVKIDNREFVENCMQNALIAKSFEDWETAEKYTDFARRFDPYNTDAVYLNAYSRAMSSLNYDNFFRRDVTFKVLEKIIPQCLNEYFSKPEEEQENAIRSMANDLTVLFSYKYVIHNIWPLTSLNMLSSELIKEEVQIRNSQERLFRSLFQCFRKIILQESNNHQKIYLRMIMASMYKELIKNKVDDRVTENKKEMSNWLESEDQFLKQRFNSYWEEHSAEKENLENERTILKEKIKEDKGKIDDLPESFNREWIEKIIDNKRAKPPIFQADTKSYFEELDELTKKLVDAREKEKEAIKSIQEEIDQLQVRVDEITEELTRYR